MKRTCWIVVSGSISFVTIGRAQLTGTPSLHQRGGPLALRGCDQVHRAELVVGARSAPVPEARDHLDHIAVVRVVVIASDRRVPGGILAEGRRRGAVSHRKAPENIRRARIEPTPSELLGAIAQGDFDVIHISCHGRTDAHDGQRTELLMGDRRTAVSAATVAARARLAARTPLVFLNACETGRQTALLTRWGGWSRTFFDAGAGAFVGTSWSVHDKPAARFAEAFYDTRR
jgi:hypothetical protein